MRRVNSIYIPAGIRAILAAFILVHMSFSLADKNPDKTIAGAASAARPEQTVQPHVGTKGMRVFRDSQTGKFGPPPPRIGPPQLTAAERHMMSRSDVGLQPRTLPGGAVAVNLRGRYRNVAVVTINVDERKAVKCVDTPAQAASVMRAEEQDMPGKEK